MKHIKILGIDLAKNVFRYKPLYRGYKHIVSFISLLFFINQPLLADGQQATNPNQLQECPDITITSLFPLKVKELSGWKITTHEIASAGPGSNIPELQDIIPYETQVIAKPPERNPLQALIYPPFETAILDSCQYSLYWKKYDSFLYFIESKFNYWSGLEDNTVNYYSSLIKLTPTSTITISIASIAYNPKWLKSASTLFNHEASIQFECHSGLLGGKCSWMPASEKELLIDNRSHYTSHIADGIDITQ